METRVLEDEVLDNFEAGYCWEVIEQKEYGDGAVRVVLGWGKYIQWAGAAIFGDDAFQNRFSEWAPLVEDDVFSATFSPTSVCTREEAIEDMRVEFERMKVNVERFYRDCLAAL